MARYGAVMLLAIHKSSNPLISKKFNRVIITFDNRVYRMRWRLIEYYNYVVSDHIQFKYYQKNYVIHYSEYYGLMIHIHMKFPEQYCYTILGIVFFHKVKVTEPRLREIIRDYFCKYSSTVDLHTLIKTSLEWLIKNIPNWYHILNRGFKIPFDEEKHRFEFKGNIWIAKDPNLKRLIAESESKSCEY
jgi:hypothetical protein